MFREVTLDSVFKNGDKVYPYWPKTADYFLVKNVRTLPTGEKVLDWEFWINNQFNKGIWAKQEGVSHSCFAVGWRYESSGPKSIKDIFVSRL